jgi:diguanylate cyclase (GGDEF)-like protein
MGGDEFLLVLLEMESRDAVALVKRAQKGLQERSELLNIPISLSFGIAAMEIEQSEEVALAAADAALYAAKREGRDRCCIAQSDQE